jgi:hypothetical protein
MQRTQVSRSNVLQPVQLKLILNPVDVLFAQGASQAGMVVKNPRADVGALAPFSAGISVSSPEGQKEKDLNTWSTLTSFQAASQRHVLSALLDPRRGSFDTRSDPLRYSQPLWFRCFPPLVSGVYRIPLRSLTSRFVL